MQRELRASVSLAWTRMRRQAQVLLCVLVLPVAAVSANDGYYRTLMPPLLPPSPAPSGQPGLCNRLSDLHSGNRGRVQKMVMMADEPRQAALSALQNPVLGVTMAGYALGAGMDAERAKQVTCVDLYFEGVAFSWNFLQSPGASARPEYSTAWQLYHQSLARLIGSAQRFGRLDPTRGLRVVTPMGMQTIPTSYQGFVWKSSDFTRVEVVDSTTPKKLKNHYSCPGIGVPLVVLREHSETERFLLEEIPFNATAVMRPSLAALAGQAPPFGAPSSHGPLEFYDPLRVATVQFNQQSIAMATNTSAALEYGVRQENYSPWAGLVRPGSAETGQEKLFMLEPYQPGKYPVVFVHGFFSSPKIWAHFANEIMSRPELRNRIQLMAYRYPTGRPFLESSAIFRRELLAMKEIYDPQGEDPGIANTAIVGHSMGGLVAKLLVTYSDDRLWNSIANRPLTDINVSDEGRRRLHDLFYFEPIPFVRRVVFMGTPHNGTQLASQTLGRWSASCVQLPASERIEHDLLIKQNAGVFTPEISKRIPTSIDLMEPGSCLLQTVRVLCAGPNVQLHNIVGVGCFSPLSGFGDGVVARRSAQHHSVSTEKQIHTSHGGLHESDEAIEELDCILRRHILEANDVPSVDGYEFAVPEYAIPECEDIGSEILCPDDSCPDGLWPADLCPDYSSLNLPLPTETEPHAAPAGLAPPPHALSHGSVGSPPGDASVLLPSVLVPHSAPHTPATLPRETVLKEPVPDTNAKPILEEPREEDAVQSKPITPAPEASGPELFFPEL